MVQNKTLKKKEFPNLDKISTKLLVCLNITKVFSNVAAKPLMLKELFLKKRNWVCPLS